MNTGGYSSSTVTTVGAFGGILLGVFAVVFVLGLLIMFFVIVVVANRAEPDPRGLRPFTVYLFGMSFLMLNLAFEGTVLIVMSLLSFMGPHGLPIADSVARQCVVGGIIVIIAGATLRYHLKRALLIARGDPTVDGPNARILHTYVSIVSFNYFLGLIVILGVAIYFVFQLIGPGIFGGGTRLSTVQDLLDAAYVMLASGGIVVTHSRLAPNALRFGKPFLASTATTS
jgi:hypothetical protein